MKEIEEMKKRYNVSTWYAFDLDRTLAKYTKFSKQSVIGEPIPEMVQIVKNLLEEGKDVRIFTARAAPPYSEPKEVICKAIEDWSEKHIGKRLPVTYEKDLGCEGIWDDKAVQVIPNTGKTLKKFVFETLYGMAGDDKENDYWKDYHLTFVEEFIEEVEKSLYQNKTPTERFDPKKFKAIEELLVLYTKWIIREIQFVLEDEIHCAYNPDPEENQ